MVERRVQSCIAISDSLLADSSSIDSYCFDTLDHSWISSGTASRLWRQVVIFPLIRNQDGVQGDCMTYDLGT